ncbi:MAG: hypothetical protein WCB36_03875 [Burkholderiales bacterium]
MLNFYSPCAPGTKVCLVLLLGLSSLASQEARAQAAACAAPETLQTFTFGGTNDWPVNTLGPYAYTVGTAPNAVTLTYTLTLTTPPPAGYPGLITIGNVANSMAIRSSASTAGTTLATLNVSFSRPVNKLRYSVLDVDYLAGAGGFNDRISARVDGTTLPTAITPVNATNVTVDLVAGTATGTTAATNCPTTSAACNAVFDFNAINITSTAVQWIAGPLVAVPGTQTVGFNTFSWCLPPASDLIITKSDASATYTPGSTGSFTITITNNGPSAVTAAQVTDNFPLGMTLSGPWSCVASAGSSCSAASGGAAGGNAVNTTLNLLATGSATITVPVRYSSNPANY